VQSLIRISVIYSLYQMADDDYEPTMDNGLYRVDEFHDIASLMRMQYTRNKDLPYLIKQHNKLNAKQLLESNMLDEFIDDTKYSFEDIIAITIKSDPEGTVYCLDPSGIRNLKLALEMDEKNWEDIVLSVYVLNENFCCVPCMILGIDLENLGEEYGNDDDDDPLLRDIIKTNKIRLMTRKRVLEYCKYLATGYRDTICDIDHSVIFDCKKNNKNVLLLVDFLSSGEQANMVFNIDEHYDIDVAIKRVEQVVVDDADCELHEIKYILLECNDMYVGSFKVTEFDKEFAAKPDLEDMKNNDGDVDIGLTDLVI
jgi:hypothetical protein